MANAIISEFIAEMMKKIMSPHLIRVAHFRYLKMVKMLFAWP